MSKYVHDEWCDLDSKGECDCYVSLLQEKDKRIAELEAELEVCREIADALTQ